MAWSFSRLKNFETCPRRYYEMDVLKHFKEPKGKELAWGDLVHHTFKDYLLGTVTELPATMLPYQKWVDKVGRWPGDLYVEQKYAITKGLTPTGYFADDVWVRGNADVVKVDRDLGIVIDWKTGAVKEDDTQLTLMAQMVFSHFPDVQKLISKFVWLKEDTDTPRIYTRQDVADEWTGLLQRVSHLEEATATVTFPAKPSGLCRKHCPVTSCEYWGKGKKR